MSLSFVPSLGVCRGLHLPVFCRLGLAYAGSNREDVLTLLLPVMGDSKSSMEVSRGCWSCRGGAKVLSVINSEKRKGAGGGRGRSISLSMKSFGTGILKSQWCCC